MKPSIKIGTAKSNKTGKNYSYIQVIIGDYEGRLYPTKAEVAYIKLLSEKEAHQDFQKGDENDDELKVEEK